uniref:Ig-like domain-containing protein n=1 Tax=Sphenodon punctatus TaxID=8508 RepID=A0A8D0HM40_SPHPU
MINEHFIRFPDAESPPTPQIRVPQKIQESRSASVTCSVPYHCPDYPVNLTWHGLGETPTTSNDNRKLDTSGVETWSVLQFTPTWNDHGKNLTCQLSSQNGMESSQSSVVLDVKYAPKGVQLSVTPNTTVEEGEKLLLECVIESSNPPVSEYRWYKNMQLIYEWQDQSVTFEAHGDEHSGSYHCEAGNGIGGLSSSKTLMIDVHYAPKETKVDMPLEPIREGSTVVLRCRARANPPVSHYMWDKAGQHEPLSAQQELRFGKILPNNSGSYRCKAQNPIGTSESSTISLDVQYAPKDVELSTGNRQPVRDRDTVTLTCSVGRSNPGVTGFVWYKDNNHWYENAKVNLLRFLATSEKAGKYQCVARNTIGSTRSSPITVDVQYAPRKVTVVLEPAGLIREGNAVTLSCRVGEANPKVSDYTWYKAERILDNAKTSVLSLRNVASADSGSYHCAARNSLDTAHSSPTELDVQYGPRHLRVLIHPPGQIIETMTVLLVCEADANPTAELYEWYRKEGMERLAGGRTLTLESIEVEESGEYFCSASNSVSGGKSQPFTVTVHYSNATLLKQGAMGLGTGILFLLLLGLLFFAAKRWKKRTITYMDKAPVVRKRGSFFVKKKPRREEPYSNMVNEDPRPFRSLGYLNEGSDTSVSYATLQFPPRFSEEPAPSARLPRNNQKQIVLESQDEAVIYSVVKKPRQPHKGQTKNDYENVVPGEEELHYSSLVNLAPRPHTPGPDREPEGSVEYAALKL